MTDLELLEKYEPVLRFAKSERFFPMAVEPYLDMCSLFPSGAHGVAELFVHLNDSDAWVWWGALSLVGVTAGWFLMRLAGVELAVLISLGMGFGLVFRGIPSRKELLNRAVT